MKLVSIPKGNIGGTRGGCVKFNLKSCILRIRSFWKGKRKGALKSRKWGKFKRGGATQKNSES